ncbi:transcriptional regulator [Alteromonas mediterranea]|uniref:HTH cro/C1-type domain-containing protein n=1 Tax=Alteromonas mediterranea (strain DSM 17117 / CIP 110805 / LMG 28347 / Deep ecotype) TaxID=1774373 RepID=F2GC79_ALTMD|nr:transcriptional regulator [Alteromonas mediterranea]AEA99035.1 hypothetical protein MADE_1014505 [Alteromonas mediterranea DE]
MQRDYDAIRKKLNYYWELKGKGEKGLTQQKAAKILGISQPAFSYYLSGRNPSAKKSMALNTDIIRKFAAMVGCKPSDIDSDLTDVNTVVSGLTKAWVPVKYALSGMESTMKSLAVNFPAVPKDCFAIEVDVENYDGLKKGQHIICDPASKVHEHDYVIVIKDNEVFYGLLRYLSAQWVVTYSLNGKTFNEPTDTGVVHYVMAIQNKMNDKSMPFK